ncbi:HDHD2-like protein [Mya arenaria]|uniref:HDHD2-like protein n=1 Tax=Mya arenaria TaxID=6604 RepID=A0ABY7G0W7_MYAAR|nr:HDHD2-like protein [Mya arenaria]
MTGGKLVTNTTKELKHFLLDCLHHSGFRVTARYLMASRDLEGCDEAAGAINAGKQALLVRTGKYCLGDENQLPSRTWTVDSFPHAVILLLDS